MVTNTLKRRSMSPSFLLKNLVHSKLDLAGMRWELQGLCRLWGLFSSMLLLPFLLQANRHEKPELRLTKVCLYPAGRKDGVQLPPRNLHTAGWWALRTQRRDLLTACCWEIWCHRWKTLWLRRLRCLLSALNKRLHRWSRATATSVTGTS